MALTAGEGRGRAVLPTVPAGDPMLRSWDRERWESMKEWARKVLALGDLLAA